MSRPPADPASGAGPTRRQATFVCIHAALTVLVCSGLCAAAILFAAPAAVVPLIVGCCVGLPMLASWRLPEALNVLRLRAATADPLTLRELRRALAELPETEHPLGY